MRGLGLTRWSTPTLSGFPGASTITRARWFKVTRLVTVHVPIASSGAVSGNIRVGLPVAAAATSLTAPVGVTTGHSGSQTVMTSVFAATTTTVGVRALSTAEWAGAVPFTWASGNLYAMTHHLRGRVMEPDTLSLVDSWPKALVAVVLIVAVIVVPSVLSFLAARQAKRSAITVNAAHKTLTTTNGGSTVKDRLERMERSLERRGQALAGLAARMTAVEEMVTRPTP